MSKRAVYKVYNGYEHKFVVASDVAEVLDAVASLQGNYHRNFDRDEITSIERVSDVDVVVPLKVVPGGGPYR